MMILLTFLNVALALTSEEAILSMTGCFEVSFQYEEVEALQEGYVLAEPKKSSVIEWVTTTKNVENQISLQHVLVTGPMIRHWRQDWVFEPRELYPYVDVNTWKRELLFPSQVEGHWGQIVTNVDDSPRYGCQARWQEDEGSTFWTCTTFSPIPRRDSKREDYTLLERENTHRIIDNGWVHEQRNVKFSYVDGERQDLVVEQGYNTYMRIDDQACIEAIEWWPSQEVAWEGIIDAWSEIRSGTDTLMLKERYRGIPLWIRLFWTARVHQNAEMSEDTTAKAIKIIDRYRTDEVE